MSECLGRKRKRRVVTLTFNASSPSLLLIWPPPPKPPSTRSPTRSRNPEHPSPTSKVIYFDRSWIKMSGKMTKTKRCVDCVADIYKTKICTIFIMRSVVNSYTLTAFSSVRTCSLSSLVVRIEPSPFVWANGDTTNAARILLVTCTLTRP